MGRLRRVILTRGLEEELKWGKPCYVFAGSNVVILQSFKAHCALLFCKGALLNDAEEILQKPGENTQAARRVSFTTEDEVKRLEPVLKAYLDEAVALEKAGRDVEYKPASGVVLPEELERKFAQNPALEKAFRKLTPGRQRGYVLYFAGAKQAQTREARIDKYTPRILEGKGMLDRPENAASRPAKPKIATEDGVVLLAGGNPQIAKGEGDAPVQAYIAAMPGWKQDLGRRLDALITNTLPDVRKAVKWNSPFYGMEGRGWFLSFHVLTRYVKVTFFNGQSLKPQPPGHTERSKEGRWIDIYENDTLNEKQMTAWIKQAAKLPGWMA